MFVFDSARAQVGDSCNDIDAVTKADDLVRSSWVSYLIGDSMAY